MVLAPGYLPLGIGRFLCIPLTVTVVLSSALPLPLLASAVPLSHYHHVPSKSVRFLTSSPMASQSDSFSQSQFPPPPVCKKVEHAMEIFGDVRIDNYYWLRDDSRTNPDVLSYLRQENAYTDSVMAGANLMMSFRTILIHFRRFPPL